MFRNALFIACAILSLAMSSCSEVVEYDKEVQQQIDVDSIERFLKENNLSSTFTKSPTGLYYQVVSAGRGDYEIEEGDEVVVNYTGKLLSGILVEKGDNVKMKFSGLPQGWREGLVKIKPTGIIRLIIPSTLAYTDEQVGQIPPNSNLEYLITLRSIFRGNKELPTINPDDDPSTGDGGVTLDPDY